MGTYFFPLISEDHYKAFLGILNNEIPATFEKWFYSHLKEVADEQGAGQTAIEIQVNPEELAAFCATSGAHPSRDMLYRFARAKGLINHD